MRDVNGKMLTRGDKGLFRSSGSLSVLICIEISLQRKQLIISACKQLEPTQIFEPEQK